MTFHIATLNYLITTNIRENVNSFFFLTQKMYHEIGIEN